MLYTGREWPVSKQMVCVEANLCPTGFVIASDAVVFRSDCISLAWETS